MMDKEKYAACRAPIKHWLETKSFDDLEKEISSITLYTGAPIIVVIEFVMEIKGRLPNLVAMQNRLMAFYHIKELI